MLNPKHKKYRNTAVNVGGIGCCIDLEGFFFVERDGQHVAVEDAQVAFLRPCRDVEFVEGPYLPFKTAEPAPASVPTLPAPAAEVPADPQPEPEPEVKPKASRKKK